LLECTYSRREQRSSLLRQLADHPAPLWVVELEVSAQDALCRFHQREQVSHLTDHLVLERPTVEALALALLLRGQ